MSKETNQQQCEKCMDELMLGLVDKSNKTSKWVSLIALAILAILFVVFTFCPPNLQPF